MKTLILKIILFLAAHMVLFFGVEALITHKMKNGFRVTFQNDWHDLKNHNADIVFIGSSRIWVEVNVFEVSKKFHAKAEIVGQDGQTIDMLWEKFKRYADVNATPKEIYVQCDPLFVTMRRNLYNFNDFKSYLFMDRYDIGNLKEKEGYKLEYKYVPLLAVGTQSLDYLLDWQTPKPYAMTHGFVSQDRPWQGDWYHPLKIERLKLEGINYLDSFNDYAKAHHIACYFLAPPISWPLYEEMKKDHTVEAKIAREHLTYLDYNNKKTYNDSTLFYNHMHLNKTGVSVFMKQFLEDTVAFKAFRH